MAAPMSAKKLLMVGALVVVVAMLFAHPTEANSQFVFFSGPCTGNVAELRTCGCNSVPTNTRGGYRFSFAGRSAAAYNGPSCTGSSGTTFGGSSTGQCSPVGWQSVFIQC